MWKRIIVSILATSLLAACAIPTNDGSEEMERLDEQTEVSNKQRSDDAELIVNAFKNFVFSKTCEEEIKKQITDDIKINNRYFFEAPGRR